MAQTTDDTRVPTESTLSSSEVSQYLHRDVQNEAALAVMAATYEKRITGFWPRPFEFERCFEVIKDGGESKWTTTTLEAAKALQPAIDYYTEVLPRDLLRLPPFAETKKSTHFGPLPPVADLDLHRFQRALYRFHTMCAVTRHPPGHYISFHYFSDRKHVSPHSDMELNEANMLLEILFYRMFQVCEKHLDTIGKRQRRPDRQARKFRDKNIIYGIVSRGLQFMYELEMQTTDKGIEDLIQGIHVAGQWNWPRDREGELSSEELCITRRTLDRRLGYKPRGCGGHLCQESCEEGAWRNNVLSSSVPASDYSKLTDVEIYQHLELIATRLEQMVQLSGGAQLPQETISVLHRILPGQKPPSGMKKRTRHQIRQAFFQPPDTAKDFNF